MVEIILVVFTIIMLYQDYKIKVLKNYLGEYNETLR